MHFPLLQRKVNSEHCCTTTAEQQDTLVLAPTLVLAMHVSTVHTEER